MVQRLTRTRRRSDANTSVPEALTKILRDSLLLLPSNPKNDYLRQECFSKFVDAQTDSPNVRRARAINKWLATERNNEATNTRLLISEEYNILPRVTWAGFRDTVASFVKDVIGDTPSWESHCGAPGFPGGFSGGATTSRRRTRGHPALKYLGKADITETALPYWHLLCEDMQVWASSRDGVDPSIVAGNVLFTVPKNAQIDRCACKEPDLNMYLQRGLGTCIRTRLKAVGVDLNDQSRNRDLARIGSTDGSLATLDLSSASDSISFELVAQLLPEVWFAMLDATRSHVTMIDGEVHTNEMFSSMGNGFTFELESLLFYCISRAVAFHLGIPGIISVYGDDIIVPTEVAPQLINVLAFLGFETNASKTFYEGPFRESCGGHYYNGIDITPFYVKAPISKLTDLIRVCNQIRRWSETVGCVLEFDLEAIWTVLASHVPKRFWGGHDMNATGQLVTYTVPRDPRRLVPENRERKLPELGRFLSWLDNGRKRIQGVTETSDSPVEAQASYRSIPADMFSFRELDRVFLTEVMAE